MEKLDVYSVIISELNSAHSLSWSPDGVRVAIGTRSTIIRCHAESGEKLFSVQNPADGIPQIAWGPDGNLIAWSTKSCPDVYLLDATHVDTVRVLETHGDGVYDMAWSPDGKTIACVYCDESANWSTVLWDAATGRMIGQTQKTHGLINTLSWSPDGRTIATCSAEGQLRLWKVDNLMQLHVSLQLDELVDRVRWSPDGRRILISGTRLRFYDVNTRGVGVVPWKARTPQSDAEWSPDGERILSVVNGDDMWVVDAETGKGLFVVDAKSGKCLFVLQFKPTDAQWSPDGSTIAVCTWDCTLTFVHNPLRTALVAALQPSSPVTTHFSNQWMYDPRVWTRVAQFL